MSLATSNSPPKVNSAVVDLLYFEFVNHLEQRCRHTTDSTSNTATTTNPEDGTGGHNIEASDNELYDRLQATGCATGRKLAEIETARLSALGKGPQTIDDIMKFVARDIWKYLHNKQVKNLRSNKKGMWKLVDEDYAFLKHLSAPVGEDSRKRGLIYLIYPCGLIQGVLEAFGLDSRVNADISALPKCCFQVEITVEKERAKKAAEHS